MQGVEPSAGLVDALGDEVGREGPGFTGLWTDHVTVLEGVMPLGIGHGAAVEPDVDEVRDPAHGAALGAHQHDLVHKGLVQVLYPVMQEVAVDIPTQHFGRTAHPLLQFCD